MSTTLILITIGLYLVGMIVVGAFYSKSNKDAADFYLGGRKLGPLVTAMSAEASDMSSWLLMGLPGVALIYGLAEASWTAIGLAIGTYINWLIVAKRIRLYSGKIGAVTIPDFFSKRYHDNKNILNLIAAVVIVVFFVPYTASGFAACGKLFNSLFKVDYVTAMLISAAVIVLYTTLGGFRAASTTDFIQSIVMTIALCVVLFFGIRYAGGWDKVCDNAESMKGYLSLIITHNPETGGTTSYGALPIASTLAWGLGYFGMPHILLRFMAIENPQKLKLSRRIASVWVVISMAIAIVIGVIGSGVVANGSIKNLTDSERIIIEISKIISTHGAFFAILAGIILAGILAATMSTADSQLLAASSSISQNILRDVLGLKISDKVYMIIARLSVVAISVVAAVIALNSKSSVFRIVSFAWAGFGATFGPVVLSALFWKRSNKWGALSGMIVGGVMVFVWKFVVRKIFAGTVLDIYELLPAFILAVAAIIIVSLLTAKPDADVEEEFDSISVAMKE